MNNTLVNLKNLHTRLTIYGLPLSEEKYKEYADIWKTYSETVTKYFISNYQGCFHFLDILEISKETRLLLFMAWENPTYNLDLPTFRLYPLDSDLKKEEIVNTWGFYNYSNMYVGDLKNFLLKESTDTSVVTGFHISNISTPLFDNCHLSSVGKESIKIIFTKKLLQQPNATQLIRESIDLNTTEYYQIKYDTANDWNWGGGYKNRLITCNENTSIILNNYCNIVFNKQLSEVFPNTKLLPEAPIIKNIQSTNLSKIIDVYETQKGTRYFITYHGIEKGFVTLHICLNIDPLWQYIDKGRILYYSNVSKLGERYRDGEKGPHTEKLFSPLQNCDLIFDLEETPLIPKDMKVMEYLKTHTKKTDPPTLITNEIIDRTIKLLTKKELETKISEAREKLVRTKMVDRIKNLDNDHNLRFILNDVTYSHDKAEYEGQILSIESKKTISTNLIDLMSRYGENDIDFDRFFDTFISRIVFLGNITGIIGKIPFKLQKNINKDINNRTSSTWKINDFRINNDEVHKVLRQALCFDNLKDYNDFLKRVSKCSLKIHTILNTGIICKITDELIGLPIIAKFHVIRNKNKHLLKIEDVMCPIHNLNDLMQITQKSNLSEVIGVLNNEKIVTIDSAVIAPLVKEARERYEKAIIKSRELLEKVIISTNSKKETMAIEGKATPGFIVQGKMRSYFLAHTKTADVYSLESGKPRRLCIVEKNGQGLDSSDQVGDDIVVNRMMALKNDQKVVQFVGTLN